MKIIFKFLIFFVIVFILYQYNNCFEICAYNVLNVNKKIDGSFRVMTYNINAPLGIEDAEVVRAQLNDIIDCHQPDILCIQELSGITFRKIKLSIDSLFGYSDSLAIKKEPHRYMLYSKMPIRNFKQYNCVIEIDTIGLDSLNKIEIVKLVKHLPFYSAEIEIRQDKWVPLFACHLRSSAYSVARRSMGKNKSWVDGIPLYIKNYRVGEKIRNWEADNLRMYLEKLEAEDTPVIIAGDFNDWSGSYCMNTIRDGKYKDAWWEGGLGFGITYDEWHLKLRLDHILYSHHFKLENVYVEKSKFSDHRPLVADFTLLP